MSEPAPGQPPRQYGVIASAAVVVGVMVGSGIFFVPGDIARALPGPGPAIGAWILGGLMALAGALTFAELATAYPRSGGLYVYLRRAWGEAAGFVFAWTEALAIFPAANALLAFYFGTALAALIPGAPAATVTIAALGALLALGGANAVSLRAGPWLATATTATKLLGIGLLLVAALAGVFGDPAPAGHLTPLAPAGSFSFGGLAAALVFLYWAYSGWDVLTYLAGEAKDPGRTVPLAMGGGVVLVGLVYLGVVLACHRAASPEQLAGAMPPAILAAEQAFGERGGAALNVLIVLTTFGSLHGSLLAGSRLSFSAASDRVLPGALGAVDGRARTPARAVVFQTALAMLMVAWADLRDAIGTFSIAGLALYSVAAAGVIRLRFIDPDRERSYRVLAYPVTPIAFIALAVWVGVAESMKNPIAVAVSAGAVAVGLIGWLVHRRRRTTASY